jgi:hypothetical protein
MTVHPDRLSLLGGLVVSTRLGRGAEFSFRAYSLGR